MTLSALIMALYTLVALLFIDCSLREGEEKGGQWDLDRILGLLLCIAWPLALAGTLLVAYQEREIG
jgi:Ca2+/Na+ antiporter